MTALEKILDLLSIRGPIAQKGKDWRCVCPAHEDTNPSLDVSSKDGRVVFICRSKGCSFTQIVAALGIKPSDCFDESVNAPPLDFHERIEATYPYYDADGKLLYEAVRLAHPKDFRQRRPAGNGWAWNLEGVKRVPYLLPRLLAVTDKVIFVCEGEKDCDNLTRLDLVATTNPAGAGKWKFLDKSVVGRAFANRRVVILPDNDEPGKAHGADVRKALEPMASQIAVLELPGLGPKGDVSDWLKIAGNDAAKLMELAEAALKSMPTVADVEWSEPIPLRDSSASTRFPIEVFPEPIAEYIRSAAAVLNVPIGFMGSACLGVAAGAMGATLALQLTPSYSIRPHLFMALVGRASSGKSPAISTAIKPLIRVQIEQVRKGNSIYFTTDATTEAIAPVLVKSPRGLMVYSDELSGFIHGFNQYKPNGGNDRQFWLNCWNGDPIQKIRANKDASSFWIPHPCISVLGGIQPAVLNDSFGVEDGFIQRFLFDSSTPLPPKPMSRASIRGFEAWSSVIEKLALTKMDETEGRVQPTTIGITTEAWQLYSEWTAEIMANADDEFEEFRNKYKTYTARLALILYAIENSLKDFPESLKELDAETIAKAIMLTRYYLANISLARNGTTGSKTITERVLDWVAKRARAGIKEPFTRRDVLRTLQRWIKNTDQLRDALRTLIDLGWIAYASEKGRSEAKYQYHPDICQRCQQVSTQPVDTSSVDSAMDYAQLSTKNATPSRGSDEGI